MGKQSLEKSCDSSSSCPEMSKEYIPFCLRILGIGRQGDGLHDLSKPLGTTAPLLFYGSLYPFQRCGSDLDVSRVSRSLWSAARFVPREAVSKFYCVLSPQQKLKEMGVGGGSKV